jgi:hypothetical protein
VGNAGDVVQKDSSYLSIIRNTITFDSNTIVVYLGNYTTAPNDTISLRAEADIIKNTEAKAFFIPGYEEWARGKETGYNAVLSQQKFLSGLNNEKVKQYPADACVGIEDLELNNDVSLLILSSQWWLHERSKPGLESDCKFRTKEEVLSEVEDIILDKWDKMVLMLTYHPMKSTGVHSGRFGIKQHIFPLTDIRPLRSFYLPLPVIGSLYPVTRNIITTNQDMKNTAYRSLTDRGIAYMPGLKKAFEDNPHTLFISGQEQSMQLLTEGELHFVVSGATKGGGRVRDTRDIKFATSDKGFSVVEVLKEKKVQVKFYEINSNVAILSHISEVADFSKSPDLAKDTAKIEMVKADSFTTAINKKLARSTFIKRIFLGENYRKEWGTDVKMKVFKIKEEKGGLMPKGLGGGHESKSLQMETKSGEKWVLRSVNKNLEPVVPEGFQETIGGDIIQDVLTGMHPYGALVVPMLQKPLGIVHATPELFFVPNDTAMGEYRPLFANTVMQLEERKPSINSNGLLNTYQVVNNMISESDHLADQKTYLKARLIDILIADFDRHQRQWQWGTIDTTGRKLYYPIPKDRDQALYHNSGLVMRVARLLGFSFMVNFKPDIGIIRRSAKIGLHMDRYFTNALTENDWTQTLDEFRTKLTDSIIYAATHQLPPEIYAIRGDYFANSLIKRRDDIARKSLAYYDFLAKRVNVLGGNKDELFKVSGSGNGTLVQIFTLPGHDLKYSRVFDASTKEVRLFGFDGADHFEIDETVKTRIKFHIVGGSGTDTFSIRGNARNTIYDLRSEPYELLAQNKSIKMIGRSPSVNEYEFMEPVRSAFSLPLLLLSLNQDDGFLVGVRLRYRTFGFRKSPYGSMQTLSGIVSPANSAFQLKYTGDYVHVFRKFDLTTEIETADPTLRYFFGYGNESILDKSKSIRYYRARHNYTSAEVLARRRFLNDSIMSISIGPAFYYYSYSPDFNRDRILEDQSVSGLYGNRVTASKMYGGGKFVLTANTVPNNLLPTQGVNWTTEVSVLRGLNADSRSFSRIYSTMDAYAELSHPKKILAALHFGGGHIFSKDFEYFQAFTLGGNNYLRGYRMNRFTGSSMAYGSAELKIKLFNFNAYVLKSDVGLVGFTDIGRVWMRNEYSRKWHKGYGGGIYIIPFNTMILSAVMAFSDEERLFNASLGARINVVFQGN